MAQTKTTIPKLTVEELFGVIDEAPDLARALMLEDINEIGKSE